MAVESKVPNYLESYLSQYTESVSKLRSNLDYRSVVRGCDFKVTFGKPLTISLLTGEETESLKYCRDLINLLHTHIGDDIVYRYFKNRLVCRAKPLYDEWEDFNSQKCSPNEALLSLTEKVIGVVQNIIYLSKDDSRELNLESLFPDQIQNFLESSKVSENPEENIPKAFEFACSSLYDSNWRMSTSRYRINRIDYLWATSIVESEKFKDISIEKNNDLLKKLFFHTLDGNLFSKYIFCSLLEHKPCDFNVDKFIESLGKEVSSRYRGKTYRKSIAQAIIICAISDVLYTYCMLGNKEKVEEIVKSEHFSLMPIRGYKKEGPLICECINESPFGDGDLTGVYSEFDDEYKEYPAYTVYYISINSCIEQARKSNHLEIVEILKNAIKPEAHELVESKES